MHLLLFGLFDICSPYFAKLRFQLFNNISLYYNFIYVDDDEVEMPHTKIYRTKTVRSKPRATNSVQSA